jgi:hypothetical protein
MYLPGQWPISDFSPLPMPPNFNVVY